LDLYEELQALAVALDRDKIDYALIGGLAEKLQDVDR
jgi:hypothetical protein